MAHRLPRHAPAAPTSPGRVMTKWTKPAATASPNSMHTGRSPARSVSTMAMNPASKPALGDFFNSLLDFFRPWMRLVVDRDELRGVDRGVALRRRQAGMAQQLLDRAQIAAAGEQMRGEAVAQRVRRGALGQADIGAQFLQPRLHDARMERTAARTDEQRILRRQAIGTRRDVSGDRLGHDGDNRDVALLVALAGDDERPRLH